MTDRKRLIEVAFPLKQASLDSVHEKNVRHGHISTLHIWPARRPLAACRAALIATLLPDPGNPEERKRLLEKIGGTVVQKVEKKKVGGKTIEVIREETVGGILHWGRESNPDLEWFRQEIRKAYGGRAPKVLDPFAGGGAIPLEAMRLGCEATAIDINPVAWFILRCTLEYPQKLAGQHRPLPQFALESPEFMESFFKSTGKLTKKQLERNLDAVQKKLFPPPDVDLAWHVRAWGWWVLREARKDLANFYPTYAEFEPLSGTTNNSLERDLKKVPLKSDGTLDLEALNSEFSTEYLSNPHNPRWVPKPTVAYLWARTVTCKNCRATVPLLKTKWLCKKDDKRVLLCIEANAERTGVVFEIEHAVPFVGGNAAQRREHDKTIGTGTMSRSGASCPCCGKPGQATMTMEDIRLEGQAGRLGAVMIAVVTDSSQGKEYRLPCPNELDLQTKVERELGRIFAAVKFGIPEEPLPSKEALGFRVPLYGFDKWYKLFTQRQLLALGVMLKHTQLARRSMQTCGYPAQWLEALQSYLAMALDRLADYNSNVCNWDPNGEYITHTFQRFALPIKWDFSEINPLSGATGDYAGGLDWIARCVGHSLAACSSAPRPDVRTGSAVQLSENGFDLVLTDPPYYNAIAYADLMDFFYVWLRRALHSLTLDYDHAFSEPLSPKWNHRENDGELIDDPSRFGGDKTKSKAAYEDGMFRAFQACQQALKPDGRLVIVFANKQPDAWETLVSAMTRAGFVADGSWPIQTEMGNRTRALSSAALSSSVWLVCKKRPEATKPGWDNLVLAEMRNNISSRLREYWDAGIRGPDFVWAATGPALEAYSKHPIVKKANEPGQVMEVPEFLRHVRRIVVDFVVGRVLSHNGDTETVTGLDDVTTYYLLHRHDFRMDDAPSGACILYAVSCGLSDKDLAEQYDILIRTGGQETEEEEGNETPSDEDGTEPEEGTGSKVKLRPWQQRKSKSLGYEAPSGRVVPLIDQVHRLMHLWKAGDQIKVDEYLDARALRKNAIFHQLLQALIELAKEATEERSLLESISNHLAARGVVPEQLQPSLPKMNSESKE
ncbi:MAG: DUF1156 domain-containing protein [Acidobacteria bacterium]|nr:DUF1156 domain-containing protein [Acidobacteriota bacterium]